MAELNPISLNYKPMVKYSKAVKKNYKSKNVCQFVCQE